MTNHAPPSIDLKERARALYDHYGGYYQAADRLGNPNLRGTLWRFLNEDGFVPSKRFMAALLDWANVDPVIIQALPGSNIFGDVGLIDFGQVVDVLILSLGEVDPGLIIECEACGRQTFKRSGTQRFCRRHSWATPEGRRYHRQQGKRGEKCSSKELENT